MPSEAPDYFYFKTCTIQQCPEVFKIGTDALLLASLVDHIEPNTSLLEIGSGTGVIGILLYKKYHIELTAIDIDSNSTACTEANMRLNNCERAKAINVDFTQYQTIQAYRTIVTNPPFFNHSLQPNSSTNLRSKHIADFSPQYLLSHIRNFLSDEGSLYCIYPYQWLSEIERLSIEHQLYIHRLTIIYPAPNKAPNRVVLRISPIQAVTQYHTLTIYDINRNRTPEYIELMTPFQRDL